MQKLGMQAYALLLLQGAIWGSSFQSIKIALEDFGPMTIAAGRLLLASIVLMAVFYFQGHRLPARLKDLGLLALIAIFNCVLPFYLIPWGEQNVDSGRAAIFMATGPLIALLVGHFTTRDERLNSYKAVGFSMGFIGVVLVIGWHSFGGGLGHILPQLALILAATSYVISGALVKYVSHISSMTLATLVMLFGCLFTMPAALITESPITAMQDSQLTSLLALMYLGLMPTGLAFLLRFFIIKRYGFTFMAQVGYLVPLFSVLFGALLLNEAVTSTMLIGLALILGGIFISGKQKQKNQA
jgi:drug/metabolite transporter (DMT)-like permease